MLKMGYRFDLDGLRGFAVSLVLIYHFFPKVLPGGFIGVDIFFVLSGYLINLHIIQELKSGRFDIFGFYQRRILRIFPALIITLAMVLIFGWISLIAIDYKIAGREVFTGAGFFSNIRYMHDGSYFDLSQHFKPLLNLWSLGVEEQFYVLWPIILVGSIYFKTRIFAFTIVLAIASLLLSLKISGVDVNEAFYSPWTRFWEILAGALVAISSTKNFNFKIIAVNGFIVRYWNNKEWAKYFYECIFFISISLTVLLSLKLGKSIALNKFPGVLAIVPVFFGVITVINIKSTLKNTLFCNRLMRYLGLISYPVFLIHWPILSFFNAVNTTNITQSQSIFLLLLSILLGALIYHFIETPIRNGKSKNIKTTFLCALLFLCGMSGYGVYKLNGFEARSETNLVMSVEFIEKERLRYWNGDKAVNFLDGSPKIIVFGDSQAYDIFASLKNDKKLGLKIFPSYHFCYGFTSSFENEPNKIQECKRYFNDLLKSDELKRADVLIYGHLWTRELEVNNTYADGLKRIQEVNPRLKVFFFGLKPMLVSGTGMTPMIYIIQKHPSLIGMNEYLNSIKFIRSSDDEYAAILAKELGIQYVDVKSIFCDKLCPFFYEGQFSYFDQVHWTESGGKVFQKKLEQSSVYDALRSH